MVALPPVWVGSWEGHSRLLTISPNGTAHEVVSEGCCSLFADLRYRLIPSGESGSGTHRTIPVVITQVSKGPVRVGQRAYLRMQGNELTHTPLGELPYCGPRATPGECGA